MDIIGKQKQKAYFKSLVENRSLRQFYIFEGADGVGKKTFADYIAAMIHCESKNPPCGKCGACIKHNTHNHPDYIYIENDETDKDKKNTTVETIRRFSRDMYVKPLLSSSKIYLLDDEKPLGAEGQNAFLKILEEPPSYVVIFMLVKNRSVLLPTVLSRGVLCRIDPCTFDETLGYVNKYFPAANEKARLISNFSGGILGSAKSLAEEDSFFVLRDNLYAILSRFPSNRAEALMDMISFFVRNKENMSDTLNLLLSWLRDIICLKTADDEHIINFDFKEALFEFSSAVTSEKVIKTAEEAEKTALLFNKGNNIELWIINTMKNLL